LILKRERVQHELAPFFIFQLETEKTILSLHSP
jgi:hypothetical protein